MTSDNIFEDENEQAQVRAQKLEELRARGIDPFKAERFDRWMRVDQQELPFHGSNCVVSRFEDCEAELKQIFQQIISSPKTRLVQ